MIQEHVKFKCLGLAIIDEQHRFGVAQRLALRGKMQAEGMEPHMLMMTATPIPRTLAMSYYADLDVSVIDELPPGRTPIVTRVVSDHRRHEVVSRIGAQLQEGHPGHFRHQRQGWGREEQRRFKSCHSPFSSGKESIAD